MPYCAEIPKWWKPIEDCLTLDELIQFNEKIEREEIINEHYRILDKLSRLRLEDPYYMKYTITLMRRFEHKEITEKMFWITINPPPDIDISIFKILIFNLISKPYILNLIGAFEQTGDSETTLGRHPHFHFMCKKLQNVQPAKMHRNLLRHFSAYIKNPKAVDVRVYNSDLAEDKKKYLIGEKQDEEKIAACFYNTEWRNIHGIPPVINEITKNDLKK